MKKCPKWKRINRWESILFSKMQRIKINVLEQEDWLSYFIEQFKTPKINLKLNEDRDCYGSYEEPEYRKYAIISLDKKSTLGSLCHEFAHHLCWTRYCSTKHSEFFIACMLEVYKKANQKLKEKE